MGLFLTETVTQPKKIAWPLLSRDLNRDLFEDYKHLIALRKQFRALQSDNIDFFHENPDSKVLAYGRWNDQDERVVVVAFSDQHLAGYRVPNFPAAGRWRELMGSEVEAGEGGLVIDLPEYEAKVFFW